MSIKAVLFDLDGTLLDSVHVILKSNRDTCDAMGIPYDEALWRSWIGIPLEVQAKRLTHARHLEYMDTYKKVYRNYQDQDLRLFPGTIEMLDELFNRSYHTALITSKATRGTQRVMNTIGLDGKFNVVITCDDVTHPKPHPEPILKGLEMLGVEAHEAVYVGDSFFDFESAHGANVKMIGVSWGARKKDELVHFGVENVFDSWTDFLDWLEENTPTGP